jgi:hypothetical protein
MLICIHNYSASLLVDVESLLANFDEIAVDQFVQSCFDDVGLRPEQLDVLAQVVEDLLEGSFLAPLYYSHHACLEQMVAVQSDCLDELVVLFYVQTQIQVSCYFVVPIDGVGLVFNCYEFS